MARPLMQYKVDQLEKIFNISRGDKAVLAQLADELQYRDAPRAVTLRSQVEKALRGATANVASTAVAPSGTEPTSPVAVPVFAPAPTQAAQTALWDEETGALLQPPIAPPTSSARPPAPRHALDTPRTAERQSPIQSIPGMSVDAAYKVLKATSGTPWEAIEQTRRQLVDQANPRRLAPMSAERRAHVQEEATRANAAYAVLRAIRGR